MILSHGDKRFTPQQRKKKKKNMIMVSTAEASTKRKGGGSRDRSVWMLRMIGVPPKIFLLPFLSSFLLSLSSLSTGLTLLFFLL